MCQYDYLYPRITIHGNKQRRLNFEAWDRQRIKGEGESGKRTARLSKAVEDVINSGKVDVVPRASTGAGEAIQAASHRCSHGSVRTRVGSLWGACLLDSALGRAAHSRLGDKTA